MYHPYLWRLSLLPLIPNIRNNPSLFNVRYKIIFLEETGDADPKTSIGLYNCLLGSDYMKTLNSLVTVTNRHSPHTKPSTATQVCMYVCKCVQVFVIKKR